MSHAVDHHLEGNCPGIGGQAPPVTTVTFDSWAQEVVRAEPYEAAFQTFARLAEIDHQLTTLEDAIERVELQVDEAIQRLIDERRGK